MKNILTIIFSILLFQTLHSQVPQGFNYQGVARDADDKVISDDFISLRMALIQGSSNGNIVYLETHQNVSTSPQGVFSIIIGSGTSNDDFESVDWGAASYFLRVDMDINNGTDYERMGTSQLLSVPYALYSGRANSVENNSGGSDGDSDPTNEIQSLTNTKNGDQITLSISDGGSTLLDINDADADPNNEIQNLSLSGSMLSISGGNSINLPVSDGTGDNWGNQVVSTDGTLTGNGTSGNPLKVQGDLTDDQILSVNGSQLSISGGNTVNLPDQVEDNDANPSNELQTLSKSGNNVTLSNGGGTVDISDGDNDNANEIITNVFLNGTDLNIEETSRAFVVDLSSLGGGGGSLWSRQGNSIYYGDGEVFFGDPTAFNTNITLNSTDMRINGIEGTEVTFNTNALSFDPIGFTPSAGSADYNRNGFEIFSGSGLETRLTDALLEILEGSNQAHLQPDNLHFHTASGDAFIYGNLGASGRDGNKNVSLNTDIISITDNTFTSALTGRGFQSSRLGGNQIYVGVNATTLLPSISTFGADLTINANDVGLNTNNPQLELHVSEKDIGGNYQLLLENDNNDWLLGAEENDNNLRFRNAANNNFLVLDGDNLNFSAVSDKRAKKNIRLQPAVLDNLMDLKVKQFEYIGSEKSTIGLIAQEVRDVFPALVSEYDVNSIDSPEGEKFHEGKVLGVNYTQLTFLNMKAIQEQQVIIDSQKTEIEELKKLVLTMKKEIDEMK